MKNKFKIIIIALVVLLIISSIIIIVRKYNRNNEIPIEYIAIFHGGEGERTYETYIYKIDNSHSNYGFKYINVTSTTESWSSTNWTHKITEKGEFDWTDGAFTIAKKNKAYSYVSLPNSNTTYTIEQFQKIFIMN